MCEGRHSFGLRSKRRHSQNLKASIKVQVKSDVEKRKKNQEDGGSRGYISLFGRPGSQWELIGNFIYHRRRVGYNKLHVVSIDSHEWPELAVRNVSSSRVKYSHTFNNIKTDATLEIHLTGLSVRLSGLPTVDSVLFRGKQLSTF